MKLSRILPAAVLASGLAVGAAQASVINFTGSATGCFGNACTPVASPASLGGLTYFGSTFNIPVASGTEVGVGGAAVAAPTNFNNWGSFQLAPVVFNYATDPTPFTLLLTFTAPPGMNPGAPSFAATVGGNVFFDVGTNSEAGGAIVMFGGGGGVTVPFTFDGGTGSLTVQNFAINLGDQTAAATVLGPVTGFLSATLTPTTVPEPMSLALFGLGLAGLGMAMRRKA